MQGRRASQKQKSAFLDLLRINGNVTLAAEGVNLNRSAVYDLRADPEFAALWDAAVAEACDRLEAEAWRRAVEGVEEPVIGRVGKDQDGIITHVRKYSDTLMATLLKAHKPEKYRERQDVLLNGELTVKGYTIKDASPDAWDDPPTE